MANSRPDVVNATLGAAFGVAFGGVWTLVEKVIEGLKFVCHCQKECISLREYLEKIKPMLSKISNQCQPEEALENWLCAFRKCVEDANEIVEKCRDGSNWEWIHEVTYGYRILKLKKEIKENVNISPMALWTHESSSKSDLGTSVMMQDVPEKILGMKDLFKRLKSKIIESQSASERGTCIAIQGMGGSGKTLLAQMVNNNEEIQENFGKHSIFWITVGRDASVPSLYVRMREYLHVETSCETPLEDQRTHLMNVFSKRRVLLILDDVWDNVHEYRKMIEWLNIAKGVGSVTLVTTRDSSIPRGINASVEKLPLLSEEHSWVLFCNHAFGTNGPPSNQELMKLAKNVCNECKSLPLALKVIGSAMKSKDDLAEWRSTLQDLQTSNAMVDKSVEQQLFDRLRISYDQLDEPTKTCFLYFAAYPEDWEIQTNELFDMWVTENLFGDDLDVEDALDKARSNLNELRRRSLVDDCIDNRDDKRVKMHDILRDLAMHMTRKGEEVVRENLFKPGMKSLKQFPTAWLGIPLKVKRLSLIGQSINRFPSNFIAPQLEICMIGTPSPPASFHRRFMIDVLPSPSSLSSDVEECVIEEGFFENMINIKYICLPLDANLKNVPTTIGTLRLLQHLDMSGCGVLEKLPESIGGLGSLKHLYMRNCKEVKELPKSIGGLRCLQHLDMSGCRALAKLPESIGGLGSLQYFNIEGCEALEKLPESIGGLGSLQHLNMRGCGAVKELPESIGGLGSLQHLNMRGCGAVKELPESIGGLGSIQHLEMRCCWVLQKLSESIGRLGTLQHLDMSECGALEKLPESIRGLGSLQHLNMRGCRAVKELPESIGGLGSLQHLNIIDCCVLAKLPEDIGGLGSLQDLIMMGCHALKKLPKSIGGLGSLQYLNIEKCWALKKLPESIGRLGSLQSLDMTNCPYVKELPESIGGLRSLQYLNMSDCGALEKLPESIGGLGSLQRLDIIDCWVLAKLPESIGGLGSLQHLNMRGCKALEKLPESIGGLGSLQHLDMKGCKALEKLPESIGGLGSLQCLNMESCWALEKLPESIGRLGSLQSLDMTNCRRVKELPESIGGLGSLQCLNMESCWALEKLPESIGRLGSLQSLDMTNCPYVKELPESIGGLRSLQYLNMSDCGALEKLPESIGGLGSLQHLILNGCKTLEKLPESIGGLKSLKWLSMENCEALTKLPDFTNVLRLQIVY